jgi:hypothetical protein
LIKKDPKKYRHIDTMEQWFEEQGVWLFSMTRLYLKN